MALKRVTFTLTVANGSAVSGQALGFASDDAKLASLSNPIRPVYLEAVSIDDSAAVGQVRHFSLYEGWKDSDGTIQDGAQLFDADEAVTPLGGASFGPDGTVDSGAIPMLFPATNAGVVDENGALVSSAYVRIPIRSTHLVARLSGGVTGDTFTAYVYYETAGDWRF